jgi:type I restriction enzyme R subunit
VTKSPIPFRPFDEHGDVRFYSHGILPHWRQAGCTYFVTFRLADSVPEPVLQELEQERIRWLNSHGVDPRDQAWKESFAILPAQVRRLYEQTIGRLLNTALDKCHGSCVLRNPVIATKLAKALDYFHGQRVLTGDYVVMPNHVHVLLTPLDGFELEDILQSIKSYSANEINRALNRDGNLWQRESYDHIVRDAAQLEAFQNYISANPLKANLREGEYILSKAVYSLEP